MKKVIASGAAAFAVLSWVAFASPEPEAQAGPQNPQPCPDGLNPTWPGAYCHYQGYGEPQGWQICRDVFNWGSNCTDYIEDSPGVFRPRYN